MAKRRKKLNARAAREQTKAQKLQEDATGVRRARVSGYNDGLSINSIKVIKAVLLAGMAVSYFLYSVLLLPFVILYGLTYFPIKSKERNLNYGVRKELQVRLPKFDGLLAIILVVVVASLVGLSALTSNQQQSMFAGKNKAQIYTILQARGMTDSMASSMAEQISKSSQVLTKNQRLLISAGTMLTGQRELFQNKNEDTAFLGSRVMIRRPNGAGGSGDRVIINNGGGQGGGRPSGNRQIFTGAPAGGFSRPAGFAGGTFGRMNFMAEINKLFKVVDLVLLVVVFAGGFFTVFALGKYRETDKGLKIINKN